MKNPKVSIIIPSRNIDAYVEKCVQECLKLNYNNFEIILVIGIKNKNFKDKRVKIIKIENPEANPSIKRNLAMKKAKGEIFAFIDSDAYPEKDWLKNAIRYFKDEKIGVVGGPQLTPLEGNLAEKISGYVLANFLVSGFASTRYKVSKKNRFVKELPSCNYISRKKISPEYKEGFLTAEDSKFCFDIKKKGYKILYAKDVIVYHHRRDTIKKHIKQMFIYGRDIAWLAKEEFSLDMLYFSLLSLFVIGFSTGLILSIFYIKIRIIFLSLNLIYLLIMLFTNIHENFAITFYVMTTGIFTHFAYGVGFIYGILKKNPKKIHVE